MKQLSEIKRMQQLAGILKESVEYPGMEAQIEHEANRIIDAEYEDMPASGEEIKDIVKKYIANNVHLEYYNQGIEGIVALAQELVNQAKMEYDSYSDVDFDPYGEDPNY